LPPGFIEIHATAKAPPVLRFNTPDADAAKAAVYLGQNYLSLGRPREAEEDQRWIERCDGARARWDGA
jgi:hypothetical protein